MPRRASARNTAIPDAQPVQPTPVAPQVTSSSSPELSILRTHWKWAAFSQFFYTFAPLLAMDDISFNDIEEDLASGNTIYLPRIMQRLLYTLSYDKKVSPDNWQTALRKQYMKRDPDANPIGTDPSIDVSKFSRRTGSIATPDPYSRARTEEDGDDDIVKNETPATDALDRGPTPEAVDKESIEQEKDEPLADAKDWTELSMLEKLDSMHLLMEWQFQNATRLRTLMKTDDEYATWRIEPVGYDAKLNSYWLIGERLWLQRAPPKSAGGSKTLKRKRPPPRANGKKKPTKRARVEKATPKTKAKGKSRAKSPTPDSSPSKRHSRAAKAQANLKLDAQARELEELNRQANAAARGEAGLRTSSRKPNPVNPTSSTRSLGTRTSARLRGPQDGDDEWQAVPDEWLNEEDENDEDAPVLRKSKRRAVSAVSSVSELTELSESDDDDGNDDESEEEEEQEDAVEDEAPAEDSPEPDAKADEEDKPPTDYVEWETICVTLYDWENIAQRWENATHYTEKAFYKMLTNNVVPIITDELRRQEAERRKAIQVVETVASRKRSSRIAIKESTREEARMAAQKKVEAEEKNGRAKRAEARQQKDDDARRRREEAREERKRELEAREAEEARLEEERNRPVDVVSNGSRPKAQANGRSSRAAQSKSQRKVGAGARTPVDGGDWDLDCEVCHRHGRNLDAEYRLVSCNACGKWQHVQCHDNADRRNGLTLRNWDSVDFFCKRCLHTSHPPRHYNGGGLPLQTSGEQYLGAAPAHYPNYPPRPTEVVSYSSFAKPYSDVRSNGNGHAPYQGAPPTAKTSAISFNHYQPQQHGFAPAPYPIPPTTAPPNQPYGTMASSSSSTGRYPEGYPTNGYDDYGQQARWDAQGPGQPPLPNHAYDPRYPPSADRTLYADTWPQKMADPYAATSYRPNS